MIYTTLTRIKAQSPCVLGWKKLLRSLKKTGADDEPLGFDAILRINGADDALWCLRAEPQHDRLWRMVAVRCARNVQHLMTDPRSIAAIDVAERHAHGLATDADLAAARVAAGDAAWAAAGDAAMMRAGDAARDAAMMQAGEILLPAVSSCHADPGRLGVRSAAPTAAAPTNDLAQRHP